MTWVRNVGDALQVWHVALTPPDWYWMDIQDDKLPHNEVRKVSFLYVFMSNFIRLGSYFLLMIDALMKDEIEGTLCWWSMRWQQDGSQMGRDQDSTLVFCESTSCMLMTSVLTPLSYTGLSKADSSVMLSYGGKDVGILIDFPWSLSKEQKKPGNILLGLVWFPVE